MKVDFSTIRVVTAIATQGRAAGYTVNDQYVTAYRLLYSENCVDFTVYNTTEGNEKVHILHSWSFESSKRLRANVNYDLFVSYKCFINI